MTLTRREIRTFQQIINHLSQVHSRNHPEAGKPVYNIGQEVSYALSKTLRLLKPIWKAIEDVRKPIDEELKPARATFESKVQKAEGFEPLVRAATEEYIATEKAVEEKAGWEAFLDKEDDVTIHQIHQFMLKDIPKACATLAPDVMGGLWFLIKEEAAKPVNN